MCSWRGMKKLSQIKAYTRDLKKNMRKKVKMMKKCRGKKQERAKMNLNLIGQGKDKDQNTYSRERERTTD